VEESTEDEAVDEESMEGVRAREGKAEPEEEEDPPPMAESDDEPRWGP
jgi:hypothetical protein